jgi:hypothetical protein
MTIIKSIVCCLLFCFIILFYFVFIIHTYYYITSILLIYIYHLVCWDEWRKFLVDESHPFHIRSTESTLFPLSCLLNPHHSHSRSPVPKSPWGIRVGGKECCVPWFLYKIIHPERRDIGWYPGSVCAVDYLLFASCCWCEFFLSLLLLCYVACSSKCYCAHF